MPGDLNRVTLIGRLTKEPELKYIQSGAAVANFSIANNRNYTTSSGEKREEVSYFDCIAWGKLGEIIVEYCQKGRRVAVECRMQQRRWEDQNGNKRSKIEVVADNVQFLDSKAVPDQMMDQSTESIAPHDFPQSAGSDINPFSDDEIPF